MENNDLNEKLIEEDNILIMEDGLLLDRKDSNLSSFSGHILLKRESSNTEIITKLLSLSSPLIFGFVSYIVWSAMIYYCVSERSLYVTEGKAMLFIYYYTIVISLFWGSSIGFEIKGSQAFGKNDIPEIRKLLSAFYTIFIILAVFFMLFSIFAAPQIMSLIPCDPKAVMNFNSEIIILSLSFPQLCYCTLLARLSNMLQRNYIQNKALLYSSIVHIASCLLFIKYLEIDSYGMGLCYLCTYTTMFIVVARDFVEFQPFGINVFTVKPMSIFDPYVRRNFLFTIYPAFNYFLYLISAEINCYFGLIISDVDFTVLSIYFNIYSLSSQFFEAIGNSMTILLSYFIGKKDEFMVWRIWKIVLYITSILGLLISVIFFYFHEHIFLIYSKDSSFNLLAQVYANYLFLILMFGSLHFVLSEFILVCGFNKFPAYVSLILRLCLQMVTTFYLVYFLNFGFSIIIILWLVVTVISPFVFLFKILLIKRKGINMELAGHVEVSH